MCTKTIHARIVIAEGAMTPVETRISSRFLWEYAQGRRYAFGGSAIKEATEERAVTFI